MRRVRAAVPRHARVRALAKINLDLRVLGKRPDGYHELRTIFQTISIADTLELSFTPGRSVSIELDDELGIADNLVTRAAKLVMDATQATGRLDVRLVKRIPMGAGLGGGSSDAAAMLLALPVLTGRPLDLPKLCALGQELGSDVPFFLLGGTAVGIGRGSELFPLRDAKVLAGVLVAPGVHVNTAQAYRDLSPRLTSESQQNKIFSFQTQTWDPGHEAAGNDFEAVVFQQHPALGVLKKRLVRAGASAAMMTGSGSALFGLFRTRADAARALESLGKAGLGGAEMVFPISFVGRARYRQLWWRALEEHATGRLWPPQSRYAR